MSKGDNLQFFTNLKNFKLISELDSVVFLGNTIMTNSDEHYNLFFLLMRNYKIQKGTELRHKKRQIAGLSMNNLLDVWKTLLSFRKYVLSNTSHKT